MTVRLTTTVSNIEKDVSIEENVEAILRFFEFMKRIGTSERYQNNNLKAIIAYCKFLGWSLDYPHTVNVRSITLTGSYKWMPASDVEFQIEIEGEEKDQRIEA